MSGDTFHTRELCRGRLTVFVQIPLHVLQNTPALARVVIGALLNAVYQADGKVDGRVLYLLDEAARLNRMSILETARDAGRKYGITLMLLYQQPWASWWKQWGVPGKSAWYASTSWRSYAGVQDYETALEVSRLCGSYGAAATSVSRGQGGSGAPTRNETQAEVKRLLIEPAEILQDLRADEQIVIRAGSRPIRCGRAIFFRRPDLAAQVAENRFHRATSARAPARRPNEGSAGRAPFGARPIAEHLRHGPGASERRGHAGCARGPGQVQLNRPGFSEAPTLARAARRSPWLGRGAAPAGHCSWHQHRAVSESEGRVYPNRFEGATRFERCASTPSWPSGGGERERRSFAERSSERPGSDPQRMALAAPLPVGFSKEAAWSRSPAACRQLFEGCFILESNRTVT